MKSIVSMIAVASAVVSLGVRADDIDDLLGESSAADASEATPAASSGDEGEAIESDGEPVDGEEGEDSARKPDGSVYHLLPFCRSVEGEAEVMFPGVGDGKWEPIEDGKYYPLGTSYRTVGSDSRLKIEFGPECSVEIAGEAAFGTRPQALGERVRAIDLISGTITVKLPTKMPEGAFSVNAPGFMIKDPVGESRYTYRRTLDGDEAIVRCVTQKLSLVGPNFSAPVMRAANEIKIVTSQDQLMTALYGSRGDYVLRLDQGIVVVKDFGTGESKHEPKFLDWKLSPQTSVRIHRAKPPIGTRKAVTVMTFDARGELHNRCAFTENMVYVNSGELGPTSKKEREALAKRAAEIAQSQAAAGAAAETSEADVPVEEESSSSSSDSDSSDDDDFTL